MNASCRTFLALALAVVLSGLGAETAASAENAHALGRSLVSTGASVRPVAPAPVFPANTQTPSSRSVGASTNYSQWPSWQFGSGWWNTPWVPPSYWWNPWIPTFRPPYQDPWERFPRWWQDPGSRACAPWDADCITFRTWPTLPSPWPTGSPEFCVPGMVSGACPPNILPSPQPLPTRGPDGCFPGDGDCPTFRPWPWLPST